MTEPSLQRVALITGAGSGIGLACAKLLAQHGWRICLVGRSIDRLQSAAKELPNSAFSHSIAADVARDADVTRIVKAVQTACGRLDALVNGAGVAPLMPIEKHTPEVVRSAFDINAIGPANLISACWPLLRQTAAATRRATIVNISSMASIDPFPGFFAYAAAKSAGNMLVKVAASEGSRSGIKAFAVAPGAVETQMLRSLFTVQMLPPSRTLSPESVADIIIACIDGERDGDNGRTIEMPSPS